MSALSALMRNAKNYVPENIDLAPEENNEREYLPFCGSGTLVVVTGASTFINFNNPAAKPHTMAGMSLKLHVLLAGEPMLAQLKPKQSGVSTFEDLAKEMGTNWKGFVKAGKVYTQTVFMDKALAGPMLREGGGSVQSDLMDSWKRGVHNLSAFIGPAVKAVMAKEGFDAEKDPETYFKVLAMFTFPLITKATVVERLQNEGLDAPAIAAALKKNRFESIARFSDETDEAWAARNDTVRLMEEIIQDDGKGKQKKVGWQAVPDTELLESVWHGRFAWVTTVAWRPKDKEKSLSVLHNFSAVTAEDMQMDHVQEAIAAFQAQGGE